MRNYLNEAELLARGIQSELWAVKQQNNVPQAMLKCLQEARIRCIQLERTIEVLDRMVYDGKNIFSEKKDCPELREELKQLKN